MPSLRWRRFVPVTVVTVALLAALFEYLPALDSPFLGDDYIYLIASRDMPLGDYVRASLDPGADPGRLIIAQDYWRPLTFLTFRGMYPLFGDTPIGYHLVNFGIHAAGIVTIWLLASRLIRKQAAAAVTAFAFAVHPAGFESVTWISALNSAGLPLALGGWLAFAIAVEGCGARRWHMLSLVLIALALGFRETAAVVLPAMGVWYLLVPARNRLRERRTYHTFWPYLALFGVYLLVSTRFFTEESGRLLSADLAAVRQTWFYVKQALLPMTPFDSPLLDRLQQLLGVVVLLVPAAALLARRWLLLALWSGFLLSLLPHGAFNLGVGPRYFYFPSAFLALAIGALVAELWPAILRALDVRLATAGAAVGLAVVVTFVALVGNRRIERWSHDYPGREQRWVDELRQLHPVLPDGGTLYATNVPFAIGILGGYALDPTVAYYYPEGTHRVVMFNRVDLESVRPWLEPRDRLFVFGEPEVAPEGR